MKEYRVSDAVTGEEEDFETEAEAMAYAEELLNGHRMEASCDGEWPVETDLLRVYKVTHRAQIVESGTTEMGEYAEYGIRPLANIDQSAENARLTAALTAAQEESEWAKELIDLLRTERPMFAADLDAGHDLISSHDGHFVAWDEIIEACGGGTYCESPLELVAHIINERDDLQAENASLQSLLTIAQDAAAVMRSEIEQLRGEVERLKKEAAQQTDLVWTLRDNCMKHLDRATKAEAALSSARREGEEYINALRWLVELKREKEENGESALYLSQKDEAWNHAKTIIVDLAEGVK